MLDRTTAPTYKPISNIHFPKPEHARFPHGLDVHYLNHGAQEVIRLEWITDSGRIHENKLGASFFTLKMLGEGTQSMSSAELQEAFQQYGAFLEFNNGFDHNTIAIYTLSRYLDEILDLLVEMISSPRMDSADLEILKNIKRQEIRLNQEKNNIVASQLFRNVLFGDDHPYGKSLDLEQVDQISIEDCKNYFRDHFLHNSQLLIAGRIEEEHKQRIQEKLGGIRLVSSEPDSNLVLNPGGSTWEDLEDSLQSSIRYGKRFLRMNHEDFIPMMILNEILGGYFGSRLMKNIREDKGYTYGIYSNVLSLGKEGYFVIGTDVIKANRDDTVREINKEIEILQNELVGSEELETVKNYMLGNLVSSMDTAFDMADKFKRVHLNGLQMNFYDQLVQTIEKIEPLTIQDLARNYLDTDSFVLVTVG